MTTKRKNYLTKIKSAANIYDLQGIEIAFKQDLQLGWDEIKRLCDAAEEKRVSLRTNEETARLKEILFTRVKAEMDAYHDMGADSGCTNEERELQRQRFCSVYQIVEEAELEDQYDAWKQAEGR